VNHMTPFIVILHPFAMVVDNVHGGVAVGIQQFFLSSRYGCDIDNLFF